MDERMRYRPEMPELQIVPGTPEKEKEILPPGITPKDIAEIIKHIDEEDDAGEDEGEKPPTLH